MQREILTDSFSNETTKSLTVTMRDGERKEIKPRRGEIFETVTARQFYNIPICAYRCIDDEGIMVRFYGYSLSGRATLKQDYSRHFFFETLDQCQEALKENHTFTL